MKLEWDFHEFSNFTAKLNDIVRFEAVCKVAAEEIAKKLLTMLRDNTPVDTGELKGGWDGSFTAIKLKTGFKVVLKNKVKYATAVNDGHKAYNQFGGPYPIHDEVSIGPYGKLRGRIAVTSPHQWQQGDPKMYVFGHFFVENSILQLNNTKQIESIIYNQLQKWWKGCFNG